MKILLTGMTSRQANSVGPRAKNDYLTFPPILYKMLIACGYEVDWRPVVYGENLSSYDLILIGLCSPNSLSNVHLFSAIWATKWKHLFYVDDYQVKGAFQGYTEKNLFRPFVEDRQKGTKNKKEVLSLISNISSAKSLLAPCFEWGNHSLLTQDTPIKKLFTIDPSPFVLPSKYNTIQKDKIKVWVSASLKDVSEKIVKYNLLWPVDSYHSKNRVSEQVLINDIYPSVYGMISMPYTHAGSGWWRARYNWALICNNILFAQPKEVNKLGTAYIQNVCNIEKMSTKQLNNLILEQRKTFLNKTMSKKETIAKCMEIIDEQ